MKGRSPQGGYTIVETMIFLAVSGMLFASAMLLVGGQQNKAEFQAAVKEIESTLQDTLNDVSTGYYRNPGNFKCNVVSNNATLSNSGALGDTQGTNSQCIFVGQLIQFNASASGVNNTNSPTKYNIYDVFGRRQKNVTVNGNTYLAEVGSLKDSRPRINISRTVSKQQLRSGLSAKWIYYRKDSDNSIVEKVGIGVFTSFGQSNISGTPTAGLKSGSASVSLVPIATIWNHATQSNIQTDLTNSTNTDPLQNMNPKSGIIICFDSGTTDQHATITIGGQGRPLGTTSIIEPGKCSATPS